jgi:hypothetical protein
MDGRETGRGAKEDPLTSLLSPKQRGEETGDE